MDVYIYQAALLCEDCGRAECLILQREGRAPADPSDESSFDSDSFPKGPYPDGGGEADCPQHCDMCGIFLENPLTVDGQDYVRNALDEYTKSRRGNKDVLQTWADYYDMI